MNRLNKEAHIIEDVNGVRCSIIEKNVSPERVEFLKSLLEYNGLEVMVTQTPAPPAKPAPKPVLGPDGQPLPAPAPPPPPVAPNTFTVGVTKITFHVMLAIYEHALNAQTGKPVSIAYWNQEPEKEEELYWMRRGK